MKQKEALFQPLELPCGVVLKNRIAKSAMSDSLGDGIGHPTAQQNRLYQCWAEGGLAVSIFGEVQPTSHSVNDAQILGGNLKLTIFGTR